MKYVEFGKLMNVDKGMLLLAHFEGEDIQFFDNKKWLFTIQPQWNSTTCYRVEPLAREIFVNTHYDGKKYYYESEDDAGNFANDRACDSIGVRYVEDIS